MAATVLIFGMASLIFLVTVLLVMALSLRSQWDKMGGPPAGTSRTSLPRTPPGSPRVPASQRPRRGPRS